jgi:hypothetical protein
MSKEKICGTCLWHNKDEIGDLFCVNDQSDHCADWIAYTDTCEEWEERE